MAQKSRDAFRTISEVAEWLDVPTHVLRFWESRFTQIKPVKRAGGRRYYRPSDMRIIGGVKNLLHDQGMTIRGVQKLFREEGVKHVSSFSAALDGEDASAVNGETTTLIDAAAIQVSSEPAPAAIASRDAVPNPIIDPPQDASEDVSITDEPPLFAHRSTAPKATSTSLPFDGGSADNSTAANKSEAENASAAQRIPATPDVPANDPLDDAAEFKTRPGPAVRLLLANQDDLEAHAADLKDAAHRLKAILERAS